eukprot:3828289-Prymnesium_polylepis.1
MDTPRFRHCFAYVAGGAFYALDSIDRGGGGWATANLLLAFRDCSFTDCSVSETDLAKGGAVYVERSRMAFDGVNFTRCKATNSIYAYGGVCYATGTGSVITWTGASTHVTDCIVNGTVFAKGGFMYLHDGAVTDMVAGTFQRCRAVSRGLSQAGLLFIEGRGAKASIERVTIADCEATKGGVACLGDMARLDLKGCVVRNCRGLSSLITYTHINAWMYLETVLLEFDCGATGDAVLPNLVYVTAVPRADTSEISAFGHPRPLPLRGIVISSTNCTGAQPFAKVSSNIWDAKVPKFTRCSDGFFYREPFGVSGAQPISCGPPATCSDVVLSGQDSDSVLHALPMITCGCKPPTYDKPDAL